MTPDYQNILVMGKSGAGKQPRIDVLVQEFGLEQLSTGDIFRHYLGLVAKAGMDMGAGALVDEHGQLLPDDRIREMLAPYASSSEELAELLLGVKARFYVDSGLFVPDALVNDLVDDAFGKMGHKGAVLDGYPRTMDQAHHLLKLVEEAGTRLDLIVLVDNEDEAIVKRTTGRRICKSCGKVFHLEYKPPKDGTTCTNCGAHVVQRSDDTEEKIWSRLREFHEKVEPTLEFLEGEGIPVAVVPGNLPVFTDEAVRESVMQAISMVESQKF
ncbi:MAG: nucleoside monophosphate kinase [Thermoplasmata archaeon]|nr:MAG: nucleoside monophosphate kinase [Thermoplasmata archaeon]